MSAIAIASGGSTPPTASHDTVLPSLDMERVPSFFLYWAAALDMLVGRPGAANNDAPRGVAWVDALDRRRTLPGTINFSSALED